MAVKQSQQSDGLGEQEGAPDDVTTTVKPESYHDKLVRLYRLVTECQSLVQGEDCQPFLGAATPETVEELTQNLASLIQDAKLNKTVDSLATFQSAIENLDISTDVNNTNYKTIREILGPIIMDQDITNPEPRLRVDGGQETHVTTFVTSGNYSPSAEVHCDWRERRCRDKKKCYLLSQHCDFNVDCEDNSDEDSCQCVERLVGDRKCDGYLDCQDGEDERGCQCPDGTSFFCHDESFLSASAHTCVLQSQVCDGREDCRNGLDEEDCYILASSLNNISPATASDHGYLSVWRPGLQSFLPLALPSSSFLPSSSLESWANQSCLGVRGSSPIYSEVSPPAGLTVLLAVLGPSSMTEVRADSLPPGHSLLSVYCGNKVELTELTFSVFYSTEIFTNWLVRLKISHALNLSITKLEIHSKPLQKSKP